MRREHGCLAIEPKNRAINVRLFREHADVVRQVARGKIIRAVYDHIVIRDNLKRVLAREPTFVRFDLNGWVRVAQTIARGF